MAFGQLTHRESLIDYITRLQVFASQVYYLGIGVVVAKKHVIC
jgi:hypothetical protein